MLTSAWLPVTDDEPCSVPERYLEIDIDSFYLPTPPTFESEAEHQLWHADDDDCSTSGELMTCGSATVADDDVVSSKPAPTTTGKGRSRPRIKDDERPRPRFYCLNCTRAFSRPDSLRRHQKLYCKSDRAGEKTTGGKKKDEAAPASPTS